MILTREILQSAMQVNNCLTKEQYNLLGIKKYKRGCLKKFVNKDFDKKIIDKILAFNDSYLFEKNEAIRKRREYLELCHVEKKAKVKLERIEKDRLAKLYAKPDEEESEDDYFVNPKIYPRGICGVYMITNVFNDFIYIGSSINIERRILDHKDLLNTGKHYNKKLQSDWTKFGPNQFKVEIIFRADIGVDRNELYSIEQMYIDQHTPEYNIQTKVIYNVVKP